MANEAKLRETLAVIKQNLDRWNQEDWAQGETNPNAADYTECKTTFCFAGWRCVLDGLRPDYGEDRDNEGRLFYVAHGGFYDPKKGRDSLVGAGDYAQDSLELTGSERSHLFTFFPDNRNELDGQFAELEQRVEEIIKGKYERWPEYSF